jgi:hypothetical protein
MLIHYCHIVKIILTDMPVNVGLGTFLMTKTHRYTPLNRETAPAFF